MKLDSKIIEGKKPLDCFDVDIAKQFIGKKGYFSDYLNEYTHICNTEEDVLQSLDEHHNEAYKGSRNKWEFFLPAEWVKPEEPEKKYRPFSLDEFFNIFEIGDLIVFKMKNDDEVKCAMFTGYLTDIERIDDKTPGAVELMLGIFHYSLSSLFEDFELLYHGKWQPFGVMEDD